MRMIKVLVFMFLCVTPAGVRAQTPVMAPDPIVPATPAMASVTVPVAAPAEMAAGTPVAMAAPTAAEVVVTPAAPAAPIVAPLWKSLTFWIGVVGSPLLAIILGILVAFKVITPKMLESLRRNKVVEIADKVCAGFEKFAEGTDVKWDDAMAQALRAVVVRLGDLTAEDTALVTSIVENRKVQAAVKAVKTPEPEVAADAPKDSTSTVKPGDKMDA